MTDRKKYILIYITNNSTAAAASACERQPAWEQVGSIDMQHSLKWIKSFPKRTHPPAQ